MLCRDVDYVREHVGRVRGKMLNRSTRDHELAMLKLGGDVVGLGVGLALGYKTALLVYTAAAIANADAAAAVTGARTGAAWTRTGTTGAGAHTSTAAARGAATGGESVPLRAIRKGR
jgi:hypothetical protein